MALNKQIAFTSGCLAGAASMLLLDPHRGSYRRALVRDKALHFNKIFRKKANVVSRDLAHRGQGVIAETRRRVFPHPVPDDILVARVASKLGRVVSNPHALELTAENGRVVIGGPIFNDEVEHLIRVIRQVQGVRGIENRLDPHGRSEKFPGLQGRRHLKGQRLDIFQSNWSPATRFLVSLAAGVFALSTGVAMSKKAA